MERFPPAVIRALEGLSEGRGRTLVVAGPPFSGKSELVEAIRTEVTTRGYARAELRGSYRHRTKPFEALASFRISSAGGAPRAAAKRGASEGGASMYALVPPMGFPGGETGGGEAPPASGRNLTGPLLHGEVVEALHEPGEKPIVVFIEDGALFDPESRDSVVYLTNRIRHRRVLVVVALDVSLPAFQSWEELLGGRPDVDWVRLRHPKPDPREAARLREHFESIPDVTQRVLLLVVLLGGAVPEVLLGRVTRLGIAELADALAPAAAVNLVRVTEGKLVIPHDAWIDLIPEFVPEADVRRLHGEVADALAAMTPEPDLKRRMELTHHYYEAARDPIALRYLLETAEICEQLYAFDAAEDLFAKALACTEALPPGEQPEAEAELRLLHAHSLAFAGRVSEAEKELREGVAVALRTALEQDRLEDWVERLLPALRTLGPRTSLMAILRGLAEQCASTGARGPEVLFRLILAEDEYEQGRYADAQAEANRATSRARDLESGIGPSAARVSAAMFVAQGGYAVESEEELFLTAPAEAGRARRPVLAQLVEEFQLRLVERGRDPAETLAAHHRAIRAAQRQRVITTELYHHLDLAEIELDETPSAKTRPAIDRAREITEILHLMPPSPALIRGWLVQGRLAAAEGRLDEARDLWDGVLNLPKAVTLPRYRAEASIRIALLELAENRTEPARAALAELASLGSHFRAPADWLTSLGELASVAERCGHGASRLPTRSAPISARSAGGAQGTAPTAPSEHR